MQSNFVCWRNLLRFLFYWIKFLLIFIVYLLWYKFFFSLSLLWQQQLSNKKKIIEIILWIFWATFYHHSFTIQYSFHPYSSAIYMARMWHHILWNKHSFLIMAIIYLCMWWIFMTNCWIGWRMWKFPMKSFKKKLLLLLLLLFHYKYISSVNWFLFYNQNCIKNHNYEDVLYAGDKIPEST